MLESGIKPAIPSHIVEERQDVIFRKVRGILNKITPETFDKLSKELVNVGLDSPRTLRGVIYLLFDKALKDLKYSSLYAKLCQALSEKAPNFEQQPGPNTFCKFLISKCEDEFERRRKATEDFDNKKELTDEEYELKAIAKQKMLGNIKFICELGKKRLLQEEILHECLRGLLSKKKERPIQDQAQDLECLCQIMRTIGSLLDIQASRNLMNQYFDRIDMFSKKPELPSRIRFMLKDVIDLRNNSWRPRPFQREDNVPQPLSKLRQEAGYDPNASSTIDKLGNSRNLIGINDLSNLHGNKLSMLLDDEPSFTTTTDFHWGPTFLPMDQPFDPFSSSTPGIKHSASAAASTTNLNTANNNSSTAQKPILFQQRENRDPFSGSFDFNRQQQPIKLNADAKRIIEVGGSAFERRPFSDPNIVGMNKEREPILNNTRTKIQPIMSVAPNAQQRCDDNLIGNHPYQQVRRFGDARQSREPIRNFNPSPPVRTINRRHQQDIIQQPQASPPSLTSYPPTPHSYAIDPMGHPSESQDNNNRERKSSRPSGGAEYFGQRARFTNTNNNINYRQFRNDRPPIQREQQHYFERSNQPESELNLNWRATGQQSIKVGRTPSSNTTSTMNTMNDLAIRQPANFATDQTLESRSGGDRSIKPAYVPPINKMNEPPRKPLELFVEERRNLLEKNPPPPPNNRDTHAITSLKVQDTSISRPQIVHQQRNDLNSGFRHLEQKPNQVVPRTNTSPVRQQQQQQQQQAAPYRRPQEVSQSNLQQNIQSSHTQVQLPNHQIYPARQVNRNNNTEIFNKREQQSYQRSFESDYQQSRFYDEEVVKREERIFKPLHIKNQIPESMQKNDTDKVPNWRRGANTASGSNTTPKEPPHQQHHNPVITSLPKPPTKVIDANFSLRPSHNLIGRTNSSVKPVQSTTLSQNDTSSNGLSKPVESQTDLGTAANLKSSTKATSSDSSLTASQPSAATGSKTNSDGSDEISSLSRNSPTRTAARDFHVNKFISVISDCSSEIAPNFIRVSEKVKELKIPKSYQHECLVSAMKHSILKSENDRENIGKLFVQLIPSIFEATSLSNAFKLIFEKMPALEVETPKVKSLVAGFLSQSILDGLMNLEDVGHMLSGGKRHPLFLLFLQKLEKSAGQGWLNDKFKASKINLMDMLPEIDRTKDRLASILKDRCLGFLDPMLTIEPDLWEQMKERDPSPAAVYRWLKENVDQTIQSTPLFAHVLISCLMRYIHSVAAEKSKLTCNDQKDETNDTPQSNKSSPSSSQSTSDLEKELLTKYQQVLQAILIDKQLQLATLYALQSFYHGLDFPKGALLRWFHMLYDMNIVDDDVFFIWKEEINDEFPGKGQALFQVNTWLNWLAEAESEEEEET